MNLHVLYSCHISCFLCHNWGVMSLGLSAGEENFLAPKQTIHHGPCVSRMWGVEVEEEKYFIVIL